MKKLFLTGLLLALVTLPRVHAQSATIDLSLGILANSTGIALTDGSLLQVIGSNNNTFFAPTATSFIGGDSHELILFQGAFDSSTTATPGAMIFTLVVPIPDGIITTGSAFIVRWYPTLTAASNPSAPGAVTFGEFGFSTGAATFIVPAASADVPLEFFTTSASGSFDDSAGFASHSISAVPEPATFTFLGGIGALGAALFRRRKAVTS